MKKICIFGIFVFFMLLTISFATAINTNNNSENKESPLYRIRAKNALGSKVSQIIENIKTKFLGERLFYVPIPFINKIKNLINPPSSQVYCTAIPEECPTMNDDCPTMQDDCPTMQHNKLCEPGKITLKICS